MKLPYQFLRYKELASWLKGGLGASVLISIIYVLLIWIDIIFGTGLVISRGIFGGLEGKSLLLVFMAGGLSTIIVFCISFILGAVIGFIYNKIMQ